MSSGPSLTDSEMAPLLEGEEGPPVQDIASETLSSGNSPKGTRAATEGEDKLLRKVGRGGRRKEGWVASDTLPFFDMPHRAVSNVTVCPSMHFSWHNLSAFTEKSEKSSLSKMEEGGRELLSNVYGVAQPGEVVAILGSSGAGKTTLLNLLAHRKTPGVRVEGAVKVNGLRVDREFMGKVSAYVQQDDNFIGSLTVREQLRFFALLRMGKKYTKKEQQRRVEVVLKELGLLPVADTVIATRFRTNISGGEKKRLAFAAEILTSPPILLCDEPTSGLDSFLAFQVVSVLRKLARRKGMTILLTIHQPSSQVFGLFDKVYLMAEGHLAFAGTSSEAEKAWTDLGLPPPENFNPADHYLATLAVVAGRKEEERQRRDTRRICDAFDLSDVGKSLQREARTGEARKEGEAEETRSSEEGAHFRGRRNSTRQEKYKSTWWQQLRMLTWRVGKTTLRDPHILGVQLFQTILIALITGMIYVGTELNQKTVMTKNGSLFQLVTNMNFLFQFSVVHYFCNEIPKVLREHQSSLYRIDAYFLAKNVAEYTLYSIIYSSILYWMSGLHPSWDAFLLYLLVAFLIMHVAISLAYMCACFFSSLPVAMAVMPIFTIPALAFSGFFVNTASLPVYFAPLRFLSYFNYGYEALAISQWTKVDSIPGCTDSTPTCFRNGAEVLESLSFHEENLHRNLFILVGMIFAIRFIGFLAIFWRSRK